jgi:fructan beta-fructosidase
VFWHAPSGRWIMAVAGGRLRIFSSADLIRWRFESVDDSLTTECPDLFELPVEGDASRTRWVLSGAGRWYMLGHFDGQRFVPETERLSMTYGPDCYATQTWSDAPDGRRVAMAWLFAWHYGCGVRPGGRIENKFPTVPWAGGCLTVPVELTLAATPHGDRLRQQAVAELGGLRRPLADAGAPTLTDGALDLELETDRPAELAIPSAFGGAYALSMDPGAGRMVLDRRHAGVAGIPRFAERYEAPLPVAADGRAAVRAIVDRASIEVFAGRGAVHLSATILPDPMGKLTLTAAGGKTGPHRWHQLAI